MHIIYRKNLAPAWGVRGRLERFCKSLRDNHI